MVHREVIVSEERVVCPECGDYSDDGYAILDNETDDVVEIDGASECAICGRWFI